MGISMTMNLSTEAYNMFLSTLRLTAFTDESYVRMGLPGLN